MEMPYNGMNYSIICNQIENKITGPMPLMTVNNHESALLYLYIG